MKEGNNHEMAKIFYCFSKLAKAGWPKDLGCKICRDKKYCNDLGDVVERWLEEFNPEKKLDSST